MARKAQEEGVLVVEFAVETPPLDPEAAQAVLAMLLDARENQAGNGGEADQDTCQADGPLPGCEAPQSEPLVCRAFT
jgi:hypothetical protein